MIPIIKTLPQVKITVELSPIKMSVNIKATNNAFKKKKKN